ncbi:hypothetical protein DmAi_27640 [Acetobacter persici]|uniref:Uncharacterized protein n=1 Tax=Acetobacter persici TaxID=1076596 RepID=A0A6V8IHF4_9PROT|nr:hypothetical protein DmAi_27640 [Acetobacter persici]
MCFGNVGIYDDAITVNDHNSITSPLDRQAHICIHLLIPSLGISEGAGYLTALPLAVMLSKITSEVIESSLVHRP